MMSECIIEQHNQVTPNDIPTKRKVGRPRMNDVPRDEDRENIGREYSRLYMRQYWRDHKDTLYTYKKKQKNQCAYVGVRAGRCKKTTFDEYCSYHKGGKLFNRPKHKTIDEPAPESL